jgi:hypothetical protein
LEAFLGGAAVGILCGPKYGKASLRRKWSVEVVLRRVATDKHMGFSTKPAERAYSFTCRADRCSSRLGLQARFWTMQTDSTGTFAAWFLGPLYY